MRYNKFLLCGVLAIALGIRLLYIHNTTATVYVPDSAGYYGIGVDIFRHPGLAALVSQYRMPLYPIFTHFVGASALTAVQTGIGLLGLVILFFILDELNVSVRLRTPFLLFIALDIMLFTNERTVLTETLTIFFLLVTTLVTIWTIKKPTIKNFLLVLGISIPSFLLRPTYILIPLPIVCCVILVHRKLYVVLCSVATILIFTLVPLSYRAANLSYHGYAGINETGEINILGRILYKNISIESAVGMPYYREVSAYRKTPGPFDNPYIFLSMLDPNIYQDSKRMNGLQQFTIRIVTANFGEYAMSVFRDIPAALLAIQPPDVLLLPQPSSVMGSFFHALTSFYQASEYFLLTFLVLYPIQILFTLQKPSRQNGMLLALGTIAAYQLGMTLFLGFGEFGRLITVAHPMLFLFCFLMIYKVLPHPQTFRDT